MVVAAGPTRGMSYRAALRQIATLTEGEASRPARARARYLLRQWESRGALVCSGRRDFARLSQDRHVVLDVRGARRAWAAVWRDAAALGWLKVRPPELLDLDKRTRRGWSEGEGHLTRPDVARALSWATVRDSAPELVEPENAFAMLDLMALAMICQGLTVGLTPAEVGRALVRINDPTCRGLRETELATIAEKLAEGLRCR